MRLNLHFLFVVLFLFTASMGIAKDYVIYSIAQSIPMGDKALIKKNYYLDIGIMQGVKKGTLLDVYRTVAVADPYTTKNRYNYKLKIGEIEVVHAEESVSIGVLSKLDIGNKAPLVDVEALMVGDQVDVHLKPNL